MVGFGRAAAGDLGRLVFGVPGVGAPTAGQHVAVRVIGIRLTADGRHRVGTNTIGRVGVGNPRFGGQIADEVECVGLIERTAADAGAAADSGDGAGGGEAVTIIIAKAQGFGLLGAVSGANVAHAIVGVVTAKQRLALRAAHDDSVQAGAGCVIRIGRGDTVAQQFGERLAERVVGRIDQILPDEAGADGGALTGGVAAIRQGFGDHTDVESLFGRIFYSIIYHFIACVCNQPRSMGATTLS